MGGGHVSRPDFGMAQPDPAHPLTEFYLLVQQALDKAGCFALPALYASLQAPARRIYPEEAREYLRLAPQAGEGFVRLQAAVQMQVLYSSLQVAADGAPAALLLTEECTRSVTALQLLPPFVWEDPLPPLPDVPAALTLQLTVQDVEAIDADPAALGRRLVGSPAGKCWLTHPKAEPFLAELDIRWMQERILTTYGIVMTDSQSMQDFEFLCRENGLSSLKKEMNGGHFYLAFQK